MLKLLPAFPGHADTEPGIVRRFELFFALKNGFIKQLAQRCAALMGKALAHWGSISRQWSESGDARVARRQQDYLAQASDQYDLEYRIRELDRNNRPHSW